MAFTDPQPRNQNVKLLGQPAKTDVMAVRGVALGPAVNKYASYKDEKPVSTLGRVIKNLLGSH